LSRDVKCCYVKSYKDCQDVDKNQVLICQELTKRCQGVDKARIDKDLVLYIKK